MRVKLLPTRDPLSPGEKVNLFAFARPNCFKMTILNSKLL